MLSGSKTALVNLDTANDLVVGTPFDCVLKLPIQIPIIVQKIELLSVEIPLCFYTIRTGVNDQFKFEVSEPDVLRTATLPQGNYTITALVTEIQTQMNAPDPSYNFVVSYSSLTNKISITADLEFAIVASNSAYVTGFISPSSDLLTNVTANACYNLSYDTHLFIAIQEAVGGYLNPVGAVDYKVPINVSLGSVLLYQTQYGFQQSSQCTRIIDQLRIRVYDRNFSLLNNNGQHWSMTIKIYFA